VKALINDFLSTFKLGKGISCWIVYVL